MGSTDEHGNNKYEGDKIDYISNLKVDSTQQLEVINLIYVHVKYVSVIHIYI